MKAKAKENKPKERSCDSHAPRGNPDERQAGDLC